MKRSLIASFAVLSMVAAPALAATTANTPAKPMTAKVAKPAKHNKLAGAKVTKTAAKKAMTKTN